MNGELPLVSVAVVCYRQREFIGECLAAILAQDYPRIEIVVADDHSDDGTRQAIASVDAAHPGRLTILPSERNLGIHGNHQRALNACNGDYVAWMAGDDLMLPGKISAQVELMEADLDCAISFHDLDLFDSDSGRTLYRSSAVDTPREGGIETLARYGAFNLGTSNMVRRSMSANFDPRVPIASDWLYYTECLSAGGTIRYIPRVLGRYRRHAGNITASTSAAPPRRLLIDHIVSCAILEAKHPDLVPALAERRSHLFAQQRWEEGGRNYSQWLRASLSARFSLRIAIAAAAFALLGTKV